MTCAFEENLIPLFMEGNMLERFVDHQTNIPYRNLRTGKEEIMER